MSKFAQVVCNERGRFLENAPLFCELVGRSPHDLLTLGWEDLVHPEDWTVIAGAMERALSEGRGDEILVRVMRPEGSVVWVHLSMTRGRSDVGATTMAATLQPFLNLFPDASLHQGIMLILDALSAARSDREVILDSLEDCRWGTIRMAGAFVAMAGVAQERQLGETDQDTRDRLNRTMAGAQAIAESVSVDMPAYERRPH